MINACQAVLIPACDRSLMLYKLLGADVSFSLLNSAVPWERKKKMSVLRCRSGHHLGCKRLASDLLDLEQQLASLDYIKERTGSQQEVDEPANPVAGGFADPSRVL